MTDTPGILFIDDHFSQPDMQEWLLGKFGVVIRDFNLTPYFSTAEDGAFANSYSVGTAMLAVRQTNDLKMVVVDLEFGGDKTLGIDIARHIRKYMPDLPIVCFTSKSEISPGFEELRLWMKEAGVTEYICKDTSEKEIGEIVKEMMKPFSISLTPKTAVRSGAHNSKR